MTEVATLLNDFLGFCLGFGATLVKVDDSQPLTSVSWTESSSSSVVDLHISNNNHQRCHIICNIHAQLNFLNQD